MQTVVTVVAVEGRWYATATTHEEGKEAPFIMRSQPFTTRLQAQRTMERWLLDMPKPAG